MEKIKLFCFPYAGGSALAFKRWKQYLDPQIELRPVELAGRGKRFGDALYSSLSESVEDVFQRIKDELEGPYVLFGHSMGALIAYELARKIKKNKIHQPLHIFISGKGAPHIAGEKKEKYHLMDDVNFKKELLALGGTPPEFFAHPELMELFLPLLKNDFRITQMYKHDGESKPLDSHITVFLGKKDDLTQEQCEGWKNQTVKECVLQYFDGGHFFLNHYIEQIIAIINSTIFKAVEELNYEASDDSNSALMFRRYSESNE